MLRWNIKSIIYSGGGDPLAWTRGSLRPFITQSTPYPKAISTNAVGLGQVLHSDCLAGLRILQVSIRGYDEKSIRKSAGGAPSLFHLIDRNINQLRQMGAGIPGLQVTGKITANKQNVECLPEMFDYCRSLGFDPIVVKLPGDFEMSNKVCLGRTYEQTVHQVVGDLKAKYPKYVTLDAISADDDAAYEAPERCFTVELRMNMLIRANGDVFLCTVSPCSEANKIGNVNETPLHQIWNGRIHREVVRRLTDTMNSACKTSICRHYRYNYVISTAMHGGDGNAAADPQKLDQQGVPDASLPLLL